METIFPMESMLHRRDIGRFARQIVSVNFLYSNT